jgi:saccharopine dehydrogenase (NAD+, L-lysine-forming)
MTKLGILREGKTPPDKRVPFTPLQCKQLLKEYPGLEIIIQPSPIRCYTDDEYGAAGLNLQEDISQCDVLMGIKEVPIDALIPGKKYFFFSHTIKKQAHNKKLIKAFIEKKIAMVDYECLTDINHNRVIGFGRYAGIVGAYNGILGYGKKYNLFNIKPANLCHDRAELEEELKKVHLSNIKILLTGGGRVANGATETLGALKIRKVTAFEFLNCAYREPVYCQLHSKDYYEAKDGSAWNSKDFYSHPQNYLPKFLPYTKNSDLLIVAHFWDPRSAKFFTKEDMKSPDFRISVIADITCDMDGSIPSTLRASTIEQPFYGYNPATEKEDDAFNANTVTIMAVDNLPCELSRDSSEDFGKELTERVIPALLGNDATGLVSRATICENGKLTKGFEYLKDYAF